MKRKRLIICLALLLALAGCSARPGAVLPAPEYTAPSPTPSPSPSPSPSPEPPPEPTPADEYFVISMCGDCTLSSSQRDDVFETVVGGDMAYPFSGVEEYFEDDYLTIANLECVLSAGNLASSATFEFKRDPGNAAMLAEGGVDFVTLGNYHAIDFGQAGLEDTQAALGEAGVAWAAPDGSYVFCEEGGISVGLYAAPWNAYEAQVRAGVRALAGRGDCDIVICLMHWGEEGKYRPNYSQTALGRAAIDSGADIVYGSHPHTLQPVEEYAGGYIVYSLGNFVFGGNNNPSDKDTAILRFTVKRDASGTVSVEGVEKIPCSVSSVNYMNDFRPTPYEPGSEAWERTMSKLDGSFSGPDLVIDYSQYAGDEAAGSGE